MLKPTNPISKWERDAHGKLHACVVGHVKYSKIHTTLLCHIVIHMLHVGTC